MRSNCKISKTKKYNYLNLMDQTPEKTNLNKNEPRINRGFELMLRYNSKEETPIQPEPEPELKLDPAPKPKRWWRIW